MSVSVEEVIRKNEGKRFYNFESFQFIEKVSSLSISPCLVPMVRSNLP